VELGPSMGGDEQGGASAMTARNWYEYSDKSSLAKRASAGAGHFSASDKGNYREWSA
jgi:hypothetical protein